MKLAWIPAVMSVCVCGCGTFGRMVSARSVPQPVSCTASVYDANGKIRTATPQDVVRHIELSKKRWYILWGVPFGRYECDLSPELEKELQENSGDAIVNLTVQAGSCDSSLSMVAGLIPVIPAYSEVKVEADVVRFKDSRPGGSP